MVLPYKEQNRPPELQLDLHSITKLLFPIKGIIKKINPTIIAIYFAFHGFFRAIFFLRGQALL